MTDKEAIKWLNKNRPCISMTCNKENADKINIATDMAIKALEERLQCEDIPFTSSRTFNDYLNDQLKNPEFVKAYEEVRPEIDAIRNSKGNDTMSSVFMASPTEVIKVGEPLSNSDEIRQAFENGEIYKRGFEDARKRYERPTGEWISIDDINDSLDRLNRYKCSECGRIIRIYDEQTFSDYPFCHCGADMRRSRK